MVILSELPDPQVAELLAARLRAEGIESQLTGEPEGPYRLTIGQMALTKVWVHAKDLNAARTILDEFVTGS